VWAAAGVVVPVNCCVIVVPAVIPVPVMGWLGHREPEVRPVTVKVFPLILPVTVALHPPGVLDTVMVLPVPIADKLL
jgi:hypothetical protein